MVIRPKFQNVGLGRILQIINKEDGLLVNGKKDLGIFSCHNPRVLDNIVIVV